MNEEQNLDAFLEFLCLTGVIYIVQRMLLTDSELFWLIAEISRIFFSIFHILSNVQCVFFGRVYFSFEIPQTIQNAISHLQFTVANALTITTKFELVYS